ncbi:MAG: DUF2339 domain-containing protein [Fimbriimonas sp.]
MNEPEADAILTRLQRIEEALRDANRRIADLERSRGPSAAPSPPPIPFDISPSPPPIIVRPVAVPKEAPPVEVKPYVPPTQTSEPAPKNNPKNTPTKEKGAIDDVEYVFGLQGLLRGGAAVVVIGLIFLVGLAISRRWITPQMQFGGEIALCLAFIGLGFWKRNEKEDFGQILIGIGSCGLYLSFAAAHTLKAIITGEALIGLFVVLSLLNLGYSLIRSSRSFLLIGLAGGLWASTLPMRQGNVQLDIILCALILAPATLIIRKNRWQLLSVVMALAAAISLVPALEALTDWQLRMGALYALTLLFCWLYAETFEESEYDSHCALVPIALMAGALYGLRIGHLVEPIDPIAHSSLNLLVLTAGAWALSYRRALEIPRNALLLGGLLVAIVLVPVRFSTFESGLIYSGFGIALALASLRMHAKVLANLAWMELVFSLVVYSSFLSALEVPPAGQELTLLAAAMATTVAAAYASFKAGRVAEKTFLVGSLLCSLAIVRTGVVTLELWQPGGRPEVAVLLTTLALSWSLLAVGARTRWFSTLFTGWTALLISLAAYAPLIADKALAVPFELILLLAFVLGILGSTRATWNPENPSDAEAVLGATGFLISGLLVRLTVVLLSPPLGQLLVIDSSNIGLLFVAALGMGITHWKGVKAPVGLAWGAFVLSCVITFGPAIRGEEAAPYEIAFLVASLAMTVTLGRVTARVTNEFAGVASVCVIAGWILLSRLGWIVIPSLPLGIEGQATLTTTWIAYAIGLITVGFRFNLRHLRYWSLAIFGTTVIKVFAIDVAGLDPAIRVLMLLTLGIAMLGGGFAYIRRKSLQEVSSKEDAVVLNGDDAT